MKQIFDNWRQFTKADKKIITEMEWLDFEIPEVAAHFKDSKTFIDNSCGDGQFLGEILIRKVENGIDFETALSTIYGVDLMPDNVKLCQDRLLCGREDLRHIVEQNIVCADALRYHYRFDGTDPALSDQDLHISNLFTFE